MSTAQLSNQTLAQLHPATPLGGTPADSVQAAPRYAEQLAEIAGRLQRRFPSEQISQADLEGRVRSFSEQTRRRASGAAQPQGESCGDHRPRASGGSIVFWGEPKEQRQHVGP